MRESLAGKRVLIVRLSSLGDLILVLPTFKALRDRYPDAYIAWLVQDSLKELLEGTEGLDEIIPVRLLSVTDKYASPGRWFQGFRGLVQGLLETAKIFRQRGFEVVLEFQGLMKSALFAFLNRKASRYGFRNARELSPLLLNRPLFIRDKGRHAVDNYLQFAAHFGCPTAEVSFPLHIPKEAQDRMDRLLASHGLKEGEPLIFICATARWQSKFWHQEGFARVADELSAASEYIHIAIYSYSPQDENPNIHATLRSKSKNREVLIAADLSQFFQDSNQNMRDALSELQDDTPAEVRLCSGHGGDSSHAVLHDKFSVIDGHTVVLGSYNYTYYATVWHDENILVVNDSAVAEQYDGAFQEIWSRCTPLSEY